MHVIHQKADQTMYAAKFTGYSWVGNPAQGKRLYELNCASCNGEDLKGCDKGTPFLHPVYEPSHHGDASFQATVRDGTRAHHWKFGDMRPVPRVSADDVAHITAFVRQQQRLVGIR